jgi:tRNA pseudouridine38-40 synthase
LKYFFHIAYKGNQYHGWQRQSRAISVQEVIENALSKILKTPHTIMGCGRTDAQVHASQFFFHLEVAHSWDFDLLFRLNRLLPPDIAVFEIIPMLDQQHARFDAIQRTYNYFVHTHKDPFLSESSSFYPEQNLNLLLMKQATTLFAQHTDFMAFCKTPANYKHTLCQISSATLFVNEQADRIRFQISANRFLSRMVRMMVGALLEVGRGKLSVDDLAKLLASKQASDSIKPAYPQGLYLTKVNYRYLDIPTHSHFSSMPDDLVNQWLEV